MTIVCEASQANLSIRGQLKPSSEIVHVLLYTVTCLAMQNKEEEHYTEIFPYKQINLLTPNIHISN